METTDLTVRILQEIRDDVRGLREEQRAMREEQRAMRESSDARFETIETALRDMAQQLSMERFSVTSDGAGFVIDTPTGGTMDPKSLVFRRR